MSGLVCQFQDHLSPDHCHSTHVGHGNKTSWNAQPSCRQCMIVNNFLCFSRVCHRVFPPPLFTIHQQEKKPPASTTTFLTSDQFTVRSMACSSSWQVPHSFAKTDGNVDESQEFPQRVDESTSQEPIEVVQIASARIHPYDCTVVGSFIQEGRPLHGAKKALISA